MMTKKRRLLGLLPIPLAAMLSDGSLNQFLAMLVGGLVWWIPYWLAWWLSDGFNLGLFSTDKDYETEYRPSNQVQAGFNPFTEKPGWSKGRGGNKTYLG